MPAPSTDQAVFLLTRARLVGQAEDLQKAEKTEAAQAARIAELEGEITGTCLDSLFWLFFAGSWANPSPLLTGNDEEYLAARALASSLSQTNRELTHNYKGLSRAYEELKVEGQKQEEELHQTQDALDKQKEEAKALRESLTAISAERDKAAEALSSSADMMAKKDAQIEKLVAMVNAARSTRATLSTERNKWKTQFLRKFLVLLTGFFFFMTLILTGSFACAELQSGALRAAEYVDAGTPGAEILDLASRMWAAPRSLEEHCREVAIDAGARVAATVKSWFPPLDLGIIKDGAHPNTTDDQWQGLLDSSRAPVTELLSDVCTNPGGRPLDADLQRPNLAADIDDGVEGEDDLDADAVLEDDYAPPS